MSRHRHSDYTRHISSLFMPINVILILNLAIPPMYAVIIGVIASRDCAFFRLSMSCVYQLGLSTLGHWLN